MAGRRRTSFSGVFIAAVLAVMLLPGEYRRMGVADIAYGIT